MFWDRRHDTLINLSCVIICWTFHYFPFFTMTRSLYPHHYCPAFSFPQYSLEQLESIKINIYNWINYISFVASIILDYYFENWSYILQNHYGFISSKNLIVSAYSSLIIFSYIILYPTATYITEEVFKKSAEMHYFLKLLNFGQP